MNCPGGCKHSTIVKAGKIPTRKGKKQRFRCNSCGRHFFKGK